MLCAATASASPLTSYPPAPLSLWLASFCAYLFTCFVISLASALRNLLNALRGIRNYNCVRAPICEFVSVCACVLGVDSRARCGNQRYFASAALLIFLSHSPSFPVCISTVAASASIADSLASPVFYACGRVSLCIWHNDKNQQAPKCTESEGIQTKRNANENVA